MASAQINNITVEFDQTLPIEQTTTEPNQSTPTTAVQHQSTPIPAMKTYANAIQHSPEGEAAKELIKEDRVRRSYTLYSVKPATITTSEVIDDVCRSLKCTPREALLGVHKDTRFNGRFTLLFKQFKYIELIRHNGLHVGQTRIRPIIRKGNGYIPNIPLYALDSEIKELLEEGGGIVRSLKKRARADGLWIGGWVFEMALEHPSQMPDNLIYEREPFHVIHGLRRRPPHNKQQQLPPPPTITTDTETEVIPETPEEQIPQTQTHEQNLPTDTQTLSQISPCVVAQNKEMPTVSFYLEGLDFTTAATELKTMMPAPVKTIHRGKEQLSGEEVIVLTFSCIEDARTVIKHFSINTAEVRGKALYLCGCNKDLSDGQLPDESESESEELNNNNTSSGGWQKKRRHKTRGRGRGRGKNW